MRYLTNCTAGLLIIAAAVGCGGSSVEPPAAGNVTRAWQITKCEYQNQANPAEKVDLIANGWVISLHINDNHGFRYSYTRPGGAEQFTDGTWRIDGQALILSPAGVGYEWQFTAQVGEETTTLRGGNAEFDFNADGTPEQATWNMAMRT